MKHEKIEIPNRLAVQLAMVCVAIKDYRYHLNSSDTNKAAHARSVLGVKEDQLRQLITDWADGKL